MARPSETNNKKQREIKKQQHLREKKQKAEERKAGRKPKALEDMMAYLDENGNISNQPPDLSKRKEIALEDIQIGTPTLEERGTVDADLAHKGRISFFNRNKGYGFIQAENGGERLFFHVQYLNEDVEEGDMVTFIPGRGPRGPQAMDISKAAS